MKKVSKNVTNVTKLQSLQPTYEALCQYVARAHIQVAAWRNSLEPNPPALDSAAHGWYVGDGSLAAVKLPLNIAVAPDVLLKVIKCSCKGEKSCNTHICSCSSSGMTCTVFCHCKDDECWNHCTRINAVLWKMIMMMNNRTIIIVIY